MKKEKSGRPVVERVAELAMKQGGRHLADYGARWAVESFFSALKRTTGSTLTSRKPSQLLAEAAFKLLAYSLRR